ncbi:choice-of-anchor G family protein [Raineyella sp. W15-4]|uniref:choice-of-anchor G family protein n=1 Tax=Raineyella sp. W15-4 TaxID=3081651 RepID=UPI0029552FD8|nr:choice-of-anchor G family protein [Raineyella sp. W15-4]WOQ16475.1 choice-of-anchor G family protein [Raineyella sp. W15-4]
MSDPTRDPETSGTANTNKDPFRKPSRRAVVVGTAWAVPAVIAANAAPAWAASPHDFVPCSSGHIYQTVGRGRFLSGSLLGTNLDTLASVNGIVVSNDGHGVVTPTAWGNTSGFSATPVSGDAYAYAAPLSISALNAALNIGVGPISLPVNTPVGLVNQYGRAVQNGFSAGASGAVNNNGVIQTDNNGAAWPDLATLDLKTLVSSVSGGLGTLVGGLTNLKLVIGAVAARATLDACAATPATRQYLVSYVKLVVGTGLLGAVISALGALLSGVTTITDPDNLLSINTTSGELTIDLGALVQNAYPGSYSNKLNGLAPNTALLINDHVITTLTDALVAAVLSIIPGGVLYDVLRATVTGLLTPVVSLLSSLLGGLFSTTDGVVNIVLNAQNSGGPSDFPVTTGAYDVAALWLTVLPGVANGVNLYLARASVGPNPQV